MRFKKLHKILLHFTIPVFLLPFLSIKNSNAQTMPDSSMISEDTVVVIRKSFDSVSVLERQIFAEEERQPKSGTLAMILSAIVPGAGQIYAHRFYTIPVIYGFGFYFASTALKYEKLYQDYRNLYMESVRLDTVKQTGNSIIKEFRDFYHNKRDEFFFYLGITYILNIVDAYVGAVLYDFSVSDNLGGSVEMKIRIPLN